MKRTTAYLIGAALVALSLSACSATGENYQPKAIPSGQSSIVVYRTPMGGSAPIDVNGAYKCRLFRNGFFELNVPANSTTILSTSLFGDPFKSVYQLNLAPRQRKYVRVEINSASQITGTVFGTLGGFIGGTAASAVATQEGSFVFRDGNEGEALQTRQGC